MARFDSAIATAIRLIEKNGMQCEWIKEELTLIDPDKPWLGHHSVPVPYNPFICFVPASGGFYSLVKLLSGTESPAVKTWGLMAPQDFKPELTDIVTRSGEPLKFAYIDTLKPNEQDVLHIMGLVG